MPIPTKNLIFSIQNPFLYLSIMLSILAAIIFVWLIACGLLLQLPLVMNTPFDTLGFVFGFVWGFFASSWALLLILEPTLSNFDGFSRVLIMHLKGAPVLYSLHCLCFTAAVCWSYFLFKGLMARTAGRTKTIIKISAILTIIGLTILLIDLLFGDVIISISNCQPINPNEGIRRSWFAWLSGDPSIASPNLSSPQEMATNIVNIMHNHKGQAGAVCQNLDDTAFRLACSGHPDAAHVKNEALTCRKVLAIFEESFRRINLEVARLPTGQTAQSGIQNGLQAITEKVLTPAAEVALESAIKGVGESALKTATAR
jgi:hypothetical protein